MNQPLRSNQSSVGAFETVARLCTSNGQSFPSSWQSPSFATVMMHTTHLDSPHMRLLQSTSPIEVQYASYKDDGWADSIPTLHHPMGPVSTSRHPRRLSESNAQVYLPKPLRPKWWISFTCFLFFLAVLLEIGLCLNNKSNGWKSLSHVAFGIDTAHFAWTVPIVFVVTLVTAFWGLTDFEVKRMQAYVDLAKGDADARQSLYLDYHEYNVLTTPWHAAVDHQHYFVFFTSIFVLFSYAFSPLASALFVVRSTWITSTDVHSATSSGISLNLGATFQDLTTFMSAGGYASSSVLYNIGDPSFANGTFTTAVFDMPTNVNNGTVIANVTAVESQPNCVLPDTLTKTKYTNASNGGTYWTNSATSQGCFFTWDVTNDTVNLFGTSANTTCTTDQQFSPVVFWFFTYKPAVEASIIFCRPNISLWEVEASVDIATRNLTSVRVLAPFDPSSSSSSANMSQLDGQAYNGIGFNLTGADKYKQQRAQAVQVQMPSAVFQKAETGEGGLVAAFNNDTLFLDYSTQVYTTYLQLIARSLYFLPSSEPMTMTVKNFQDRLFMSNIATHLLAAAFFVMAIVTILLQMQHRKQRKNLHLRDSPHTIVGALRRGAGTHLSTLVQGLKSNEECMEALKDRMFWMDPVEERYLTLGEPGYEEAVTPRVTGTPSSGSLVKRASQLIPAFISPTVKSPANMAGHHPRKDEA